MFNSVTWYNFFSTVLLLVGGYYFITILLLYHREIKGLFNPKPKEIPKSKSEASKELIVTDDVLGVTSHEDNWFAQRTSSVNAEEVQVSEFNKDETPDIIQAPGEQQLITGVIADLMQEINTLLVLVNEYQSSKEECTSLFNTLFLRYPQLRGTAYQHAINRHICEENKSQFSFPIQPLDVRSWWENNQSI